MSYPLERKGLRLSKYGSWASPGGFGAGSGGKSGAAFSNNPAHVSFGGGGGGLAAGGDVFVQQGGTLTIEGGSLGAATLTAGTGGSAGGAGGASTAGGTGSAFGGGIFIQGNQTVTFAPGPGEPIGSPPETLTISDVITDQKGNGGTGLNAGVGSLAVNGVGTVKLNATNTYTGDTALSGGGTLELGVSGSGGSGSIVFQSGSTATLQIDGTTMPTNTINAFATGDFIDLRGLLFVAGATANYNSGTHVLTVTSNSISKMLTLTNPAVTTFSTPTTDGFGGTQVSLVSGSADLSVTKTDGKTSVVPGTTDTYTITVTNTGPTTVSSVTLTDTTPSAFLNLVFTPSVGTYTSATGLWSGLSLASGQSVSLTLSGTIDPNATGSISNTATVSPPAGVSDTNAANNTATDTDTLTPQADLSVTKTDGKTSVVPGTSDTYTITVTNNGPSTVSSLTLTDTTPSALLNPVFTPSTGSYNSANGQWSELSLASGQSVSLTLSGTIDANATGSISNTVTVAAPAGATDTNAANNSATDTDTLTPQADLSVTKTDGVTTVVPGTSDTYTITVTNNGPSTVSSFTLTDPIPSALLNPIFGSASAGSYDSASGLWSGLSLASGQSVTITLSGTIDPAATFSITNTATVSAPAGVTDTNPANDTATDIDTLTPEVALSIAKSDGKTTVVPGTSDTYTITVTNNGPSTVSSLTLTDPIPSAFLNPVFTPSVGTYISATGAWSGLNLASGHSVSLTLSGTIDPAATGSISNTATVSPPAGVTDTNIDNTATHTDTLTPQADLSITKTDGLSTIAPGTSDTYTITVTNNGPSTVSSVTLTDVAPSALLNPVFGSPSAGSYNSATGVWSGLSLASGQSVSLTLSGTIDPNATGSITNTVTVAAPAGVTDTNPGNNSATDTDRVPSLSVVVSGSSAKVGFPVSAIATPDAADAAAVISYQWQSSADNGATWNPISGATGSTYVLAEGDENKFVRAHASFTVDNQLVSADSNATATKVVDDSSLSVSISGTAREGATLTATPTIGDSDDTGATVSYQWEISTDGSTWSNITGSTGSTYLVAQADEDKFVRVHASFTDDTSQLISSDSAAARIAIFESAPVVTPTSLASNIGHVNPVAASSLFTASDVDGDVITQYDFWDTGTGGGHWMLNGVALGANHDNFVPAPLLPLVAYLNETGTDTLFVRANDGNQFGAWSQAFTVTDTAPVVTPKSLSFALSHDAPIATSTLFSASDADTDPIVSYDFFDTGAGGGHWMLNGVALGTNQDNFVSASQLAQVNYQSNAGTDTLWVRAFDGVQFGAWTSAFTVTDTAPVTTATSLFVSGLPNVTMAVSTLFTTSDADGDTLMQYDLFNTGVGGGRWLLNGAPLSTNTDNFLTPAQLAGVTYRDGSGGDTLWMRASDGLAFGNWSPGIGVASGPVVIPATSALTASHLQTIAATSLFTASDADGDTLTQYDFWDTGVGGGRWLLNGSPLAPNQDNILPASLLSQVSYRSGAGTDTLYVRASDGTFGPWSAGFTVTDTAPVTTPVNNSFHVAVGQTVAATSLFAVNDVDTDTIAQYDVWDTGAGGGRWLLNGTPLGINQDNPVSAAQLSQLTYKAGAGGDTLWMRASDGLQFGAWSQGVTETNTLPVVTPLSSTVLLSRANTVAASRLFTATDSDGDPITTYDFWNTGVGDGQWLLNGVVLPSNQDNFVAASQLSTVSYRSGPGLDTLYVRASDGAGFGVWSQPLTVTDSPPITTALDTIVSGAANLTFAASSLFTASDPDQDSIALYDVWSSGGGGGTWLLNGLPLATNTDNFISADQLPQVAYRAGTSTDTIWMRASGLQFGAWSQAVTVVDAPVATPNNNAVLGVSGQTFAGSTLFTATDADGDTITQFDLWDTGAGGGRWLLNGSPLQPNQDNIVNAAQLSQVTYKVGTGTDTLFVRASDGTFGPWSNAFTVADPPAVPAGGANDASSAVTVAAGQTVEIASGFSGSVTFAGDTGTLKLDNSSSFAGTVAGMTGQDTIDFAYIDPTKVLPPSYSGDASGGTLHVTDGTHSGNIALLGNYMASLFVAGSDGHGGTSVVDPPALGGVAPLVTPPHG